MIRVYALALLTVLVLAGQEQPKIFRITPVRPVAELRTEALASKPPTESGEFRPSDLVDVAKLDPRIKLDVRYATTDNFLSTPVYSSARAFLQRPAAEALLRAQRDLVNQGYGLLIFDAYRPWYVTKMFWDATPPDKHQFVADPSQGSRHNRGCAVDLTIYELATGREVPMTGVYDEMSERSYPTYTGGTAEQRGHRDLLRAAMEKQGFTVYETEWWHFDYKDWPHYAIQNVAFEQLQQREPLTIPLWPSGAPGAPANLAPEADTTTAKDNLIAGKPVIRLGNVSNPTLTVYTPTKNNTGDAVVVFPGGGYHILAMDLEGTEVCDWLTSQGITCALVKYRVPDSGPYPKSSAALQDAQRAVGIVRSHAADWHIDARKIGVLGFSAGAHLAAALSTHYDHRLYGTVDAADALSCRPDFAVIVYPGYLANAGNHFAANADIEVNDRTPPTFIVQAEDDPVHVENAVVYFLALKNAKVPAELHIYATGGHGYGLRPDSAHPVTQWPRQVEIWLHTIHMLPENP